MKKNLIVKQDGYKECGAAALLSIIRYYKGNISINKLVELTNTTKIGTNFYQLKHAADKLNLDSEGYQVTDINLLHEIAKPFICQITSHNYEHFIVIYEMKKNKIIAMDPASGERIITIEEFQKIFTGYIMVFSPRKKLPYYKETKFLNKIIIEVIFKNKSIVLNILLLSMIFTVISCLYTMYYQVILDFVLNSIKNNLLIITFTFSILLLIKSITSFFRNELLIYLNQKIDCSIFLNTFKKILLLPYNYYKNKTTGEMVSRINDLIYVKNILNKIILTVFLDFIIFLMCGMILLIMNPIMFLLLVIIILIYFVIFIIFRPFMKRYTNINQINNANINSLLIESISGFETIKSMHTEKEMNLRMEELYTNTLNANFIYENVSNLELFLKELVSSIGILLVEFIGFYSVMNQTLSLGNFLSFIFLTNYFITPIQNIIDLSKEYFYALNALKRVNHLFDIESENLSTKTNFIITGNIHLNNLSFSYTETNPILKNIQLTITKSSKVMILGESGSGKSTILKLLYKLYSINRDMIYIDDIDINDYSINNIRNEITTVSQNEIIYTDTIKNNITLYQDISDQDFIEVCKMTYINEFVKKMFLGYNTKLEENGQNLSGGQKQRIILARALLRPSKILLIDEGLNAIDINLERKILKNIFTKYSSKTIIIVSHRTENIDLFQQIIKLKTGEVIENIKYPKEKLYD